CFEIFDLLFFRPTLSVLTSYSISSPDRVGIKKGASLITFGGHLGLLCLLMVSKSNRFCHFSAGRLETEIVFFDNCCGVRYTNSICSNFSSWLDIRSCAFTAFFTFVVSISRFDGPSTKGAPKRGLLINATAMMELSRCERINAIPSSNRIVLQGSLTLALPKFLLKVSVIVLKALKEQSSPDDKIVEPLCPW
uniref:Uncharacterized protein n=1 Tax=Glossina palpalis gambiensis TaxID=67801 RepID=A0A1B0C7R0_9MUSC